MDDLLKSVDSVSHAIRLVTAVKKMCAAGGFRLTKFVSNDPSVLEGIPFEDRAQHRAQVDLAQPTSIERPLGIHWCIQNDCLEFRITLKDRPLTRRGMLSTISSIYDPLGLAAPFMLNGKKLLQNLATASWTGMMKSQIMKELSGNGGGLGCQHLKISRFRGALKLKILGRSQMLVYIIFLMQARLVMVSVAMSVLLTVKARFTAHSLSASHECRH